MVACHQFDEQEPEDFQKVVLELIHALPRLRVIDMFSIFEESIPLVFLNRIKQLRPHLSFGLLEQIYLQTSGRLQIDLPRVCRFANRSESMGACAGPIWPWLSYSCRHPHFPLRTPGERVVLCQSHRLHPSLQCFKCELMFVDESLVALEDPEVGERLFVCYLCHDLMILDDDSMWIRVSWWSQPSLVHLLLRSCVIYQDKNLCHTLKPIGDVSLEGIQFTHDPRVPERVQGVLVPEDGNLLQSRQSELNSLIRKCKKLGISRMIARLDHSRQDRVTLYGDARQTIESNWFYISKIEVAQMAMKRFCLVVGPILFVCIASGIINYAARSLEDQSNLEQAFRRGMTPGYGFDTGSIIEEQKSQTNSMAYLISMAVIMSVIAVVGCICWWKFQRLCVKLSSFAVLLDFIIILTFGLFMTNVIVIQWLGIPLDMLSHLFIAINISAGSLYVVIRNPGSLEFKLFNPKNLQMVASVIANVVLLGVLSISLSFPLLLIFISLPILVDFHQFFYRSNSSRGFIWASPTLEQHVDWYYSALVYCVPKSTLRMMSADMLWYGILITLVALKADAQFMVLLMTIQGTINVSLWIICVFVFPHVDSSNRCTPIFLAFCFLGILIGLRKSLYGLVSSYQEIIM